MTNLRLCPKTEIMPLCPSSYNITENTNFIIERTALSIGMSLAFVPIMGLLLNYTPGGIRLTPTVLSLVALTVVFAVAAVLREHQISISKKA